MQIYTSYHVGNLPPVTKEINKRINNVEKTIANLIVDCAGNFHALQKLYEVIGDARDTCDLNLSQIEIIIDEEKTEIQ
jgi:hypothetical protein